MTIVDRARGREIEERLAAALYQGQAGDEAVALVRRMVRERVHRGSGGITTWFPRTIAGHDLDQLIARFCASPACRAWRDMPFGVEGCSLEEALYRFFVDEEIGDPIVREDEFAGAIVRSLAVTPRARFTWPPEVRPAPGGCFAVTSALVLHAAVDCHYLRGTITPMIAAALAGAEMGGEVRETLRRMRLLA
jgi:hypothetical protein